MIRYKYLVQFSFSTSNKRSVNIFSATSVSPHDHIHFLIFVYIQITDRNFNTDLEGDQLEPVKMKLGQKMSKIVSFLEEQKVSLLNISEYLN